MKRITLFILNLCFVLPVFGQFKVSLPRAGQTVDALPASVSLGERYTINSSGAVFAIQNIPPVAADGVSVIDKGGGLFAVLQKSAHGKYLLDWFGANPDDVVSDSLAFILAKNFLPEGGQVVLKEGQYLPGTGHVLDKSLRFQGVQGESVLKVDSTEDTNLKVIFQLSANGIQFDGVTFQSILKADTTLEQDPRSSYIRAFNANQHIEDLLVTNCTFIELENGIRTLTGKNNQWIGNRHINCKMGNLFQRDTGIVIARNYYEHSNTPFKANSGKYHHIYLNSSFQAKVVQNRFVGMHSTGRAINLQAESEADSVDQTLIAQNSFYNTNSTNIGVFSNHVIYANNTVVKDTICDDCGDGKVISIAASSASLQIDNIQFWNKTAVEVVPINWPDTARVTVNGGEFRGRFEFSTNDDLSLKFSDVDFLITPYADTYPIRKSRRGELELHNCTFKWEGNPAEPAILVDNADGVVRLYNCTFDNNHGTDPFALDIVDGFLLVDRCTFDGFTRAVDSNAAPGDFRVIEAKDDVGNYMVDTRVAVSANYSTRGEKIILLNTGITTLTISTDDIIFTSYESIIVNRGTAAVTIDPESSRLINGDATMNLAPGASMTLVSDGSNVFTKSLAGFNIYTTSVSPAASATSAAITHNLGGNVVVQATPSGNLGNFWFVPTDNNSGTLNWSTAAAGTETIEIKVTRND